MQSAGGVDAAEAQRTALRPEDVHGVGAHPFVHVHDLPVADPARALGVQRDRREVRQPGLDRQGNKSFEELKRLIHSKLVDKLDLSRVSDLEGETLLREIRLVVERLGDTENPLLNRMERERL